MQSGAYQQMRGLLREATCSDSQPHSPKIVNSWFLYSHYRHLPDRQYHVTEHNPLSAAPPDCKPALHTAILPPPALSAGATLPCFPSCLNC